MIPVSEVAPVLTVLQGGRAVKAQHFEEAAIEYRVLCDEVELLAFGIQTEVGSLQVPSMTAIALAGRIGVLVSRARAEIDRLTSPDGAA